MEDQVLFTAEDLKSVRYAMITVEHFGDIPIVGHNTYLLIHKMARALGFMLTPDGKLYHPQMTGDINEENSGGNEKALGETTPRARNNETRKDRKHPRHGRRRTGIKPDSSLP